MITKWFADGAESGTAGGEGGKPTGTADANTASVEELRQQVADLTSKHAQALAEKTGYEDTKKKLAEAQQMLARVLEERQQPPTNARSPFAQVDADIERLQAVLRAAPNDPLTQRDLRRAFEERDAIQWELQKREAAQVISQVTPEALRDRAWQMYLSGNFGTPDMAILAARGSLAEQEQKTRADDEARKKAEQKPATGTPDAGAGAGQQQKGMTGSEYVAFLVKHEGTSEAQKLITEYDNGRVPVDWTR